jgi:uncharacterized protein (TIGR02996 family)
MTHEEAFLHAIIEDPDDDALRLIYADWLEERGDRRGEFIRVQCRLAKLPDGDPERGELEARQRALLEEHEEEWTGALPRVVARREFERGFLTFVEMPAKGFSQLAAVFGSSPTVRSLRLLGPFRSGKPSMQVIAGSPHLARLTSLDISKGYYHVGPAAVATLVASPHVGRLTALSLHENAIGPRGLATIVASPLLSRLTTLSLSLYGFRPEEFLGVEAVQALASSPSLARLTALRLRRCGIDDEGCRVLAASPKMMALTSLDLHYNNISDQMKSQLRARFGNRVHL